MSRRIGRHLCQWAACLALLVASAPQISVDRQALHAESAAPQASVNTSPRRVLIDKYCVTCHNARRKAGDLQLDHADVDHPASNPEIWERVIRKLSVGAMPPPGMPRPDAEAVGALLVWLKADIDQKADAAPHPGRPALHRLNRVEYANTVRDLLALDVDATSLLPADDAGYGFDNVADVLRLSPGLLERYMRAAQKISRAAIGDEKIKAETSTYKVPYLTLLQDDRVGDDLPAGSRGGLAVRHYFPLDGEYIIKVRVQRTSLTHGGEIRGLDEDNQIDVRVDGERVRLFVLGSRTARQVEYYDDAYATTDNKPTDEGLNVRLPIKAGAHVIAVSLQRTVLAPEGLGPSRLPPASFAFADNRIGGRDVGRIDMGIDHLQIEGPLAVSGRGDTPSRRRIFVCRPLTAADESGCAATVLRTLARRAYRRPVTKVDLESLLSVYAQGRRGGDFEEGIQWALETILVDPDFLFRVERDPESVPAGGAYRISDLELASRLSFFLWSSPPDDELLNLATVGKLREAKTLKRQVRRMMSDERAGALATHFFGQWLYLRNVATVTPDPKAFPHFDDSLRTAFQRETELFLKAQLSEDRPLADLLNADYTFVNERLAKHYGLENVYGSHFRRVTLPDPRRAGLLGQGSTLLVTSYANRTSPVVRGKWILENLLGVPPPAPPANVPALSENDGSSQPRSVRDRLEQHRKNPVCAACHAQMDPLGFALENFDGVGQWRNADAGTPVDASGVLPNGAAFRGPAEFRKVLLSQSQSFVTTATEKLMTYSLGRGVESADMPAVRRIVQEAGGTEARWSTLILSLVRSVPFQMRSTSR